MAGILAVFLAICILGVTFLYQNVPRADRDVQQESGKIQKATETSTPRPSPTPTPDYSNLSLGEVAVTDEWALSVYSVSGKQQPSIIGNDFMRYSISCALKNISPQTQYYTLNGLPIELLDRDGYNIQSGRNTMFSPELPVFIPSGLVIRDGVVLDVTSFPVEPLQVVILPDFADNRMVFSGGVQGESPSLTSEEERVGIGEVVPFDLLKLELLASDYGAEVAFHNESDQEMRIEWKDSMWLDLRPSFYPDAQVMVALFLNEQGRLCVAQASGRFPSQIGAGMRARGHVTPACGGDFGKVNRLLIFDASSRTVVFDLNQE
jgi:hypothetical protein